MTNQALISFGRVIGFVPGYSDFVVITDGFYAIHAYVPFKSPSVQPGQFYNVYKQGATYYVGTQMQGM